MLNIKKLFTIKSISKISSKIGFTKFCYFINRNRKRVIAYHNIIPDEYFDNSIHLSYSTKESNFRKHLDIIKKNFSVGLDYKNPNQVTLTFDDGYINQYKVASKLLDKCNVLGYFFCAANLIEGKEPLTIDKITYWFSYVPYGKYRLEKFGLDLKIHNEEDRSSQWEKISKLIYEGASINNIENDLDLAYKFDYLKLNENFYNLRFKGIDKDSLEHMKSKGHKIGAHSAAHMPLAHLSKDELERDISKCKEMVGTHYNTKVFAYPFGGTREVSEDVMNLVKHHGFESAFSFINHKIGGYYNNFFMPRMEIPNTEDEEIIEFILSGGRELLKNRRLLPKID